MFLLPSKWMDDLTEKKGNLHCPQCKEAIGKWDWLDGLACGCGHRCKPAYIVLLDKIATK